MRASREYSGGTILFHQAVGDILEVNPTDMRCLDLLMSKGSASPTELAEHVGLSSGATTAMIDRLEKAGLVEHRPNPKDRRGKVLILSDVAKSRLQTLFNHLAWSMGRMVSKYSEEELETLNGFFARALVVWKDERERILKDRKHS